MGFMEKMRGATGPVLWVLVFAFGILFMLQDTDVFSVLQAGPRSMGEVDGRPITQNDYNQRLNAFTENYTRQTGNPPSIEQRATFEELVWNQLVVERALEGEMERLGIDVTDREIVEAILGDNPDPIIRQLFGRPDGSIDRATLRALIDQPETQSDWIMIEDQIRENRRQQKLNQFMQSSIMVTNREIEQDFIQTNTRASVSFVRFPYSDISDSEIEVSDSELRAWHRENARQFERERTWDFRFVSFSKAATAEDTARALQSIAEFRNDFATTTNDSMFVEMNFTTTPFTSSLVDRDDVPSAFAAVLDLEVGEVTEPLISGNEVALVKKTGSEGNQVSFAVLSRVIAADRTITRQQANAEDFREFARLDGFEREAEQQGYTITEATATKGAPFVPGLGESRVTLRALERLSRNQISPVIELDDRFIVLIVDRVTEPGVRPLAEVRQQVENAVRAEKRRDIMMQRVRDLYAGAASLDAISEQSQRSIQTASAVRMNSTTISGAGREPGVVGAIFGTQPETLTGPIRGENAAFFLVVTEREDADLADLTQSERDRIRTRLAQQKTRTFTEQLVERLQEQVRVRDFRQQLMMM